METETENIEEGILYLLQGTNSTFDGMGYALDEIEEFLELNNVNEVSNLKDFLHKMEDKQLIEERHFDFSGKDLGRVDYSIENKGIELIEKIRKKLKSKGIKLESKWKLK